jgi:hypothetical protein
MLTFTNLVLDAHTKFKMGYVSVGIFFLNILVNLMVVMRGQCHELKLKCTKNKKRAHLWCIRKGCMSEKEKTKKEPSEQQKID